MEPIAVEKAHAAKEIAEKWLYDTGIKVHFHGPNRVNISCQEEASSVKPDNHGSDEYYCSSGVIISVCQSFREVACYISNIMQKSNN